MKYPKGSKKIANTSVDTSKPKKHTTIDAHANRGMTLEKEIVETNQYYLDSDRAVIHKKPTPVQVVQVDYPKRSAAVIKEAYYQRPSTTDFNGLYKGKHIDFEAKETNKNVLPFQNIHVHQVEHMKKIENHGGISFFIIRFKKKNETYFLRLRPFLYVWEEKYLGDRKSIPYEFIVEHGIVIPFRLQAKVDYLSIIDQVCELEEKKS
ncbi:Holliday junction resolvase RecU [Halalkalibacillus halophilus]|uniref:Holliday junction resolvase RecU n=1 Tax=Halalkalibacillus halophilus TaxID=392827 RepID=UPI00041947BE|nr:Holliday junction resolvase RecU [Halalkalibacillus halophilus]